MGRAVCEAVLADPDLVLAAAVDPGHIGAPSGPGGPEVLGQATAMADTGVEVAVDFTVAASAVDNAAWCAANSVHAVIGTTGLSAQALAGIAKSFANGPANCVVAPNFAIGAVLMMRFAELAAPWFESVEVVELHHDTKVDSPSGTALLTAQRISAARRPLSLAGGPGPSASGPSEPGPSGLGPARGLEAAPGVMVHSVRLRGLVAHQEVLFGTTGQTLVLRHDSLERTSFMSGVLLAVKEVPRRPGFTMGLDSLLGL